MPGNPHHARPSRSPATSASLEFYRKQAKTLLKEWQAGSEEAQSRILRHLTMPDLARERVSTTIKLADAQFVVARENGFASWPKLKAHSEALQRLGGPRWRPFVRDVDYYDDRARGLLSVLKTGEHHAIRLIRAAHPNFAGASEERIRNAELNQDDARLVIARQHGFASWAELAAHVRALADGAAVEPFLSAFEAIKAGDAAGLREILRRQPDLVNACGTNGNTLLNLAGSLKQPGISKTLIELGADVDLGNVKGWTPLHQAAYSDQTDLAQMLLDAGASVDIEAYGDGGTPLMQALFWGHRRTAELLAAHGIRPRNLRTAAGLGRLDLLEGFFAPDGRLLPGAGLHREYHRPHSGFPPWRPSPSAHEVIDEAFVYAAKSGRIEALGFLLQHGAHIDSEPYNGTALHWAAGRDTSDALATTRWLLDHGADVNRVARFGGSAGITPLFCAGSAGNTAGVALLIERGADACVRDPQYHATAIGWADHSGQAATRDYLLEHATLDLFDAMRFGRTNRVRQLIAEQPDSVNRLLYRPEGEPDQWDNVPLPLFRAVQSGNVEIVRMLLEAGADPNPEFREKGRSPLEVAVEMGNEEIARLLRERSEGE